MTSKCGALRSRLRRLQLITSRLACLASSVSSSLREAKIAVIERFHHGTVIVFAQA